MVITRIGPMSLATIVATAHAVLGLVLGGIFSTISLACGFTSNNWEVPNSGAMLGVGVILVFPILYAFIGFIMTLFAAWLYNIVAGYVGGIEIEVQ